VCSQMALSLLGATPRLILRVVGRTDPSAHDDLPWWQWTKTRSVESNTTPSFPGIWLQASGAARSHQRDQNSSGVAHKNTEQRNGAYNWEGEGRR
jgi:hypothetical protein